MFETAEEILSQLLNGTVEELDIPADLHEAADEQYRSIGQFLADQSDVGFTEWDVYPQGSFRLGTVVRPLGADHYDLDMVCRLDMAKDSITQAVLKERVGAVLAQYLSAVEGQPGSPAACHDNRRCWTLEYPLAFHVDVLPAIPNVADEPHGILLTDKQLYNWQKSNPVAYASWFRGRMEIELARKAAALAERKQIDPVPEWEVKTTLHRVVQVLKRHRDIFFASDREDRPPSIVVTTLAAQAYAGEQELFAAVMEAVATFPEHIEHSDGTWRVMNPVADENFADKWAEHPDRPQKFFRWLDQMALDLEEARAALGFDKIAERLSTGFGETVTKAAGRLADTYRTDRESGRLAIASTGVLSAGTGTTVRPHGFFGSPQS